jgi:hypothetical protein
MCVCSKAMDFRSIIVSKIARLPRARFVDSHECMNIKFECRAWQVQLECHNYFWVKNTEYTDLIATHIDIGTVVGEVCWVYNNQSRSDSRTHTHTHTHTLARGLARAYSLSLSLSLSLCLLVNGTYSPRLESNIHSQELQASASKSRQFRE